MQKTFLANLDQNQGQNITQNILIWYSLKVSSANFYKIFIFSLNDSPSKTVKKCFLFHLKISFCSQDFVFSIFPFFSTISRFKRKNESRIIYIVNWFA